MDGEAVLERVRPALDGGGDLEVGWIEQVVGNRSAIDTPLMAAIGDWLGEAHPGSETVATAPPAVTDSRRGRDAFPRLVAHGVLPHRPQPPPSGRPLTPRAAEPL